MSTTPMSEWTITSPPEPDPETSGVASRGADKARRALAEALGKEGS